MSDYQNEKYLGFVPDQFLTDKATDLLDAAQAAGLIESYEPIENDFLGNGDLVICWRRGSQLSSNGQLAYFCKEASTYLGFDRVLDTSWRPFEDLFNFKPRSMKNALHSIKDDDDSRKYKPECIAKIDAFFGELKKDNTTKSQQ